jgi:hypothetical protein
MTPRGVIDELQRRHAYGMLVRDGQRPRTSRYPGHLHASITVREFPRDLVRGETHAALVELANIGDSVWLSEPNEFGGFVTVGCKLLHPDGRLIDDTIGRTILPRDVLPGEHIQVRMSIAIPDRIGAGAYVLRVDAINELIAWFADLSGNHPQEFRVSIR